MDFNEIIIIDTGGDKPIVDATIDAAIDADRRNASDPYWCGTVDASMFTACRRHAAIRLWRDSGLDAAINAARAMGIDTDARTWSYNPYGGYRPIPGLTVRNPVTAIASAVAGCMHYHYRPAFAQLLFNSCA